VAYKQQNLQKRGQSSVRQFLPQVFTTYSNFWCRTRKCWIHL